MPYTSEGIGHRRTDTSAAAAHEITEKAPTLRDAVLAMLVKHPDGLNCDEIAEKMMRHYGSVRPRITELRKAGMVLDSGRRSESRWGKNVIIWLHHRWGPETQGELFEGLK